MVAKVILGQEYDQNLRDVAMDVLRELGASVTNRSWALAGSQEIETLMVRIDGQDILVEAETYMGLSITGDEDTVNMISNRVRRSIGEIPT